VPTANQVEITLTGRAPDFLARLAIAVSSVFCPLGNATIEAECTSPYAGPYYIEKPEPHQRANRAAGATRQLRRPSGLPLLPDDRFLPVKDRQPSQHESGHGAGTIDLAVTSTTDPGGQCPPTAAQNHLEQLRPPTSDAAARGRSSTSSPTLAVRYLALNTSAGAQFFSKPETLRKAVNFAIDRPR
jgi:hypothetical protein